MLLKLFYPRVQHVILIKHIGKYQEDNENLNYFECFKMPPKYTSMTPSDTSSTQKDLMKMLNKELDKQDHKMFKVFTKPLEVNNKSLKGKKSRSGMKLKIIHKSPERDSIDQEFEK